MTRGSQLQVRLYVNAHADVLAEAVLEQMPGLAERGASLEWVRRSRRSTRSLATPHFSQLSIAKI